MKATWRYDNIDAAAAACSDLATGPVSVELKIASEVTIAGTTWSFTGKTGIGIADGKPAAEYSDKTDRRLWLDTDGKVKNNRRADR